MKAEQQFDLIAEAGWQVCTEACVQPPGFREFWSAGFCKHIPDMDHTDLGRGHYDTHSGSAMIPVRECFCLEGRYIYQKRKWPTRRNS